MSNSVYAVINNDWEDGVVREVFATRELADEYVRLCPIKKSENAAAWARWRRRQEDRIGYPDASDDPPPTNDVYLPDHPEVVEYAVRTTLPFEVDE